MNIDKIYSKFRKTDELIEKLLEEGVAPKNGAYSHSSLDLCPYSYKAQKIDGVDGATITRFGQNEGSLAHKLAEFDVRMRTQRDPDDWSDVETLVDYLCSKDPRVEEFTNELTETLHKFRFNFKINPKQYVASELKMGADLGMNHVGFNNEDNPWFRGIIDYLEVQDNVARVVDFKNYPTIHKFKDINDPYNDVGKQQYGYGSLVMSRFKEITDFYYEVYYFRFGTSRESSKKDEVGQVKRRFISRQEIEEWWEYNQRRMVNRDKRKTYPPVPSQKSCQYCPVVNECPWQQNERTDEDVLVTDYEEAEEVYKELLVVEEKRKRLRTALKSFLKENKGKVTLDSGDRFGYVEKQSTDVNERAVIQACKEAGVDPSPYMNVSPTNASNLLDELHGDAKDILEEGMTEVTKTRLKT